MEDEETTIDVAKHDEALLGPRLDSQGSRPGPDFSSVQDEGLSSELSMARFLQMM